MLTIAIGDIHGCIDKLSSLLEQCRRYLKSQPAHYIFLGDYIDRGPNSCGVIERLMKLQADTRNSVTCLMGNHEDMLLSSIDNDELKEHWLSNGGVQTLASYAKQSAAELPREHITWMRHLPTFYNDGLRYYVHAGIDPKRLLSEQQDDDRLWIRGEFLKSDKKFERYLVHGHTPQRSGKPDIRRNRVNIDTGAFLGGPLTAAVFHQDIAAPTEFIFSR